MKQVVQELRGGRPSVRDVPAPMVTPHHVLVALSTSLISAGTERHVVELARKSLLGKARERPDDVRRVLEKMRVEGIRSTAQQLRARLDEAMPLGYSAAGTVLETGRGIQHVRPGDRVAVVASHAGVVSVGANICAPIPDKVSFEQGAYASVAAIALEGVRLTRTSLGEHVLVIGLGLVGQIAVGLLRAQGCRVFGTDPEETRLSLALEMGAERVAMGTPLAEVLDFADGEGVDAVLITAATPSNEPIEFAADACRVRGRIVLVGVTGLDLPRPPFFKKELEFTVSSSLGPGRGDAIYEEAGVDYPIGLVRWTAGRNMRAALNAMAAGTLPVERLTTHRFPIERAEEAYDLLTGPGHGALGILLEYPRSSDAITRRVTVSHRRIAGRLGLGVIGSGNFARGTLFPILARRQDTVIRGICSLKGMTAEHSARRMMANYATTDPMELLHDPDIQVVFVTTRHDSHAELVIAALRAGKHVFVEKPLCIAELELEAIRACIADLGGSSPVLAVGFNRRFARSTALVQEHFRGIRPLAVAHRFAVPDLPADHWTQDEAVGGGRIVGEACHAIDLCTALTGSLPVSVYAAALGSRDGRTTPDDRVFITLQHLDGSASAVAYQAGAARTMPSERVEVFGGGRSAVIDAWREVHLWDQRGLSRKSAVDKGHEAEVAAFLTACAQGGSWPIPYDELDVVSAASLAAVRSIREGVPLRVIG
jgi:predicted dehydrogenase/threonine dehydrogenase-like Zn-dependent dehydrogenase